MPLTLLRGQAYDGAGVMAGRSKGVATRINDKFPKALYIQCAAHRLNLCVVKCCSICGEVNNMMGTAHSVTRYFKYSPKRQPIQETTKRECVVCSTKRAKLHLTRSQLWHESHFKSCYCNIHMYKYG